MCICMHMIPSSIVLHHHLLRLFWIYRKHSWVYSKILNSLMLVLNDEKSRNCHKQINLKFHVVWLLTTEVKDKVFTLAIAFVLNLSDFTFLSILNYNNVLYRHTLQNVLQSLDAVYRSIVFISCASRSVLLCSVWNGWLTFTSHMETNALVDFCVQGNNWSAFFIYICVLYN